MSVSKLLQSPLSGRILTAKQDCEIIHGNPNLPFAMAEKGGGQW